MKKIVILLLVLVMGAVGQAVDIPPDSNYTWHVSKDGNNSQDGHSYGQAKLTITAAVTASASGDTIILWPGIYVENVDSFTTSKSLAYIGNGSNRNMVKIAPTTGRAFYLYQNSRLENLWAKTIDASMTVKADSQNNCVFKNIVVESNGVDALYCALSDNILIEDVWARGPYDCVYIGKNGTVIRSTFIVDGTYNTTTSCAFSTASGGTTYVNGCTIIAATGYDVGTPKAPITRQSLAILVGISTGTIIIRDSLIKVDGSFTLGHDSNCYTKGDVYAIKDTTEVLAENCVIISKTDPCQSYTAYGFNTGKGRITNSSLVVTGTVDSIVFSSAGGPWGLSNVEVTKSNIDSTNWDATATQANEDANHLKTQNDIAAAKTASDANFDELPEEVNQIITAAHGEGSYVLEITAEDIKEEMDANSQIAVDTNAIWTLAQGIDTNVTLIYAIDSNLMTEADVCDSASWALEDYNSPKKTELDEVKTAMDVNFAALPDANDNRDAIFAKTGITAGGTWTYAEILKIQEAWLVGEWQDKIGEEGTYQILDAEDQNTVIIEVEVNDTSKYKEITFP